MPGRPVQHVLADKSEARFKELLLPWIFRPNDKDYGVDGQVEVVTDGHATGLTFSVQQQRRQAHQPVRQPRSDADYVDEAMNDLRVDALDARAWFNLGVARSRAGENEPALHAFVGAALFGKCDVEAWRNAFMLAFQIDGAGVLLFNIVLAAHDEVEAAFIDAVCDSAAAQAGEEAAAAVETAIREILRYDPREPEQVQLRMIEPADTDG